jgi:heat-inducible transcriptional repressor
MVTPALNDATLRQLRFIPVSPGKLLAVVVTREGLVHNVYVDFSEQIDDRDLEKIHNYLAELVANRSLREIRRLLRSELADARKRCDDLQLKATMLGTQAIESSVLETTRVVVEGHSHLVSEPLIHDNINDLLQVLEEKTKLLGLLDRAVETDRGPLIVIGKEGGEPLEGCALISFPFGSAQSEGKIGVIGPTRMDYSSIIPLVSLSAATLSKTFNESED